MFNEQEIKAAKKIKDDIDKHTNIPRVKEARASFKLGTFPDYFYDEKHYMLYKRVTTILKAQHSGEKDKTNYHYRHIA